MDSKLLNWQEIDINSFMILDALRNFPEIASNCWTIGSMHWKTDTFYEKEEEKYKLKKKVKTKHSCCGKCRKVPI